MNGVWSPKAKVFASKTMGTEGMTTHRECFRAVSKVGFAWKNTHTQTHTVVANATVMRAGGHSSGGRRALQPKLS